MANALKVVEREVRRHFDSTVRAVTIYLQTDVKKKRNCYLYLQLKARLSNMLLV